MSEGTRSTSPNRRLGRVIAGTVLAVVAAGVIFQLTRANPAISQTEAAPQADKAQGQASAKFLGRVNDEPIDYDLVAQECVARYGTDVLENIINRMIVEQACKEKGIEVSQAEVQAEVAKIAKKFNLPVDTWYQMLYAERHLTPQQYHRYVIWQLLALKKLAGSEVVVTEDDMQKAFERDYGPRVKARMILIDNNLRHATQVWEQCKTHPEEFERLAREHSTDANTRALGGAIPPIRRHGGSPKIEEAAFKLRTGEISAVIELSDERGYVIIKSEGRTEPVITDIREVWTELYNQLVEEKTQESVANVFTKLRDEAQVINYLTNTSTGQPKPPTHASLIQQTSAVQAPPTR